MSNKFLDRLDAAIARLEGPDIDADHAVALERERIAAWITSPAADATWDDGNGINIGTDHALAQAIRDGAHWDGA